MVKLIIFDLDGTLLNTLQDLADSTNYILNQHGYPQHPLESYRYFVGNGIKKLIERVLPANQRTEEIIEPLLDEFLVYYDIHKADKTAPYEGIVRTMEQLQNQKIKMAVASNKVEEAMCPLMKYYFPTIRFAAYHGQRQGIPTKPNPQIVYDILKETAITKEETLYVGDTAVDMQTATNAGLRSIGVLWGFRDRKELEENDATVVIEKPEELLEWVKKN